MSENLYSMSRGGRVKAAGLPYSMFFEPAENFVGNPAPGTASEMNKEFTLLRKSPPDAVRDRFMPRSQELIGMIKTGAALPRTSITTHQGVGQFLTHDLDPKGETGAAGYFISGQSGFCIVEAHLENQLKHRNYPAQVVSGIEEVKKRFAQSDIREAQLAYERLVLAGREAGIDVQRDARVGREGLFFIHPSFPKEPILVGANTYQKILERGNGVASDFADMARKTRDSIAKKLGVVTQTKKNFLPLYFQTDFFLTNDGQVKISDVNLPDVGFFLTGIDPEGNGTVSKAAETVRPHLENTASLIVKAALRHGSRVINFITRQEVLENMEDTLEIKELEALMSAVEGTGHEVRTISLSMALNLPKDELGLLMNVDTKSQDFNNLLIKRLTDESTPIYPDPFLAITANAMTDHTQIQVGNEQLQYLGEVFSALEKSSGSGRDYVMATALNQIFRNMGLPETDDVFHMYIPNQPTPIPFYRYDSRGLQIALNYAKGAESVVIRSIPIKADNSVLHDASGKPVYSVFRYMFYQQP